MTARARALTLLLLLAGCGESEAPARPAPGGAPAPAADEAPETVPAALDDELADEPAARAGSVNTGDPLPEAADEPVDCAATGGYRWLGSDPHVPLAISRPVGTGAFDDVVNDVVSAGVSCCAPWTRVGEAWTALDAWGAPLGEVRVSSREAIDLTECFGVELRVEPELPAGASGLLVRGAAPWTAPPSARWEPSEAERAAALELARSIDRVFAPQDRGNPVEPGRPLEERILFFSVPEHRNAMTTHFAAVGGRAAAILGLDATGTWRTHHLDGSWSMGNGSIAETYRVIAVHDMDTDGIPEVVFHRTEGPCWDQIVLRCYHDSSLRPWRIVAESIGGTTA